MRPRAVALLHQEGPGLRELRPGATWYGYGHCGICGTSAAGELVPRAVRWWSPDDGWRVGVLCRSCGNEAAGRGPRPDDFAFPDDGASERADVGAADGDLDGLLGEEEAPTIRPVQPTIMEACRALGLPYPVSAADLHRTYAAFRAAGIVPNTAAGACWRGLCDCQEEAR